MSYEDKINSALALIDEHNQVIGAGNKGYVKDPKALIEQIKADGGTNDNRIRSMSHEDIVACFQASCGFGPKALAKDIASVFRGNTEVVLNEQIAGKAGEPTQVVTSRKVTDMSPLELVQRFDPSEAGNKVAERLISISRGEPFVVYSSGRQVDVEATNKLLMEIKAGHSGIRVTTVGGIPKSVYKVGELPENYADENPLYPGRALRPDGSCDQTGRSWDGVPFPIRQLVRIALDRKDISVTTLDDAHRVLDMVVVKDAMQLIRQRYSKSWIDFENRPDNRPPLKVLLGGNGTKGGLRDGKRVNWHASPDKPRGYRAERYPTDLDLLAPPLIG